jgi:hypothetical protein|tara:strand:+ start:415 stop:606 length:192 start_codon:yes stop_codon:yes gene_type:complete
MAHCPLEILKKAEQFEETTAPPVDSEFLSYTLWQKRKKVFRNYAVIPKRILDQIRRRDKKLSF